MANPFNTTPMPVARPDRRDFLFVGTAAAVTSGLAGATLALPAAADEKLVDLYHDYQRVERAAHDASTAQDEVEAAARKVYPDPHPSLGDRPWRLRHLITADLVDDFCEAMKLLNPADMSTEQRRHFAEYQAACDQIDEDRGIPELRCRTEALWAELSKIEREVLETPAVTVVGVLAKLQTWQQFDSVEYDDADWEDQFVLMAMTDLERLVESGVVS